MVMESKTTSKTSCFTALLLKAWRERWTDLQWAINIKTVLPRGVSGDVYNLADCILQQAVVGFGANQLALSYLKHSLSAQLVSHAAVLQSLSKYTQFNKHYCVASLLEFLEGMIPGLNCSGKPEETVLACALLSIVGWLLQVLQHCRGSQQLVEKAVGLVQSLLNDEFYVAMICLARYIDGELFLEMTKRCTELQGVLKEKDPLHDNINFLRSLDLSSIQLPLKPDTWPGSLVQYWLAVKLIGNPGTPSDVLSKQLRLFQRLKGYNSNRLYAELLRGSFLSLHDVSQTTYESQWGAFAFLKVPNILLELNKSETGQVSSAVELLLQHTPLLDVMDSNSSCSNLKCLLEELVKRSLLTDDKLQTLLSRRETPVALKLENTPASAAIPEVIICAESTLSGILKTLSSDYYKIQDALLGMLQKVLNGKSFELILAVATVQGQLRIFVDRLIRFNEFSKMGLDKARAQLFDITFLMLVAIVQTYGADVVLNPDGDKLFGQWVQSCMVEAHKPKAPEQILKLCDPAIVDSLLQQFDSGETDFKNPVKWQDVLFNMAGVMREVLIAWEQGALVAADVKRILDAVRGRMYCLPLAAAAWLCAYMRTAPEDMLLKPVNMVQQLLAPPAAEEDSLNERWQLTCELIRKMQRDVQLPLQPKSGRHLVSRQPAREQLNSAWNVAITRGWLDHSSARTVHCLVDTAGPGWLVSAVLSELLQLRYRDQLQRGVDLALALFHVNIHPCTLDLLNHALPQLLYNNIQTETLMEPQLSALALLTSYCIYAAIDCITEEPPSEPKPKMQRLNENTEEQLIFTLRQLLLMLTAGVKEGYITQQTYFAFHLLKYLVEVKTSKARVVLGAIPATLVSELLRTLPELFSPALLLNLNDVMTYSGRSNIARDLCVLRNYRLRNVAMNSGS